MYLATDVYVAGNVVGVETTGQWGYATCMWQTGMRHVYLAIDGSFGVEYGRYEYGIQLGMCWGSTDV